MKLSKDMGRAKDSQKRELEILYEIGTLRDSCRNLQTFCCRATTYLRRSFKAECAFFYSPGDRECIRNSDFLGVSPRKSPLKLLKNIAVSCDRLLGQKQWQGLAFRELSGGSMRFIAHPVGFRKRRCVVGLCTKKKDSRQEIALLFNAGISQIESAFASYLNRREQDDTISILDSLHSLDREGDETKDEHHLLTKFVSELQRKIRPGFILLFMIDSDFNGRTFVPAVSSGKVPVRAGKTLLNLAERALQKFYIRLYDCSDNNLRYVGVNNLLLVPLGVDRAEGVFFLGNKKGGFTDLDFRFAEAIESLADSILEHARAYTDLQRKKNELKVLYQIDRIRDSAPSFDEMIDRVLRELVGALSARRGFAALYDMQKEVKSIHLMPKRSPADALIKEEILEICRSTVREHKIIHQTKTHMKFIENWISIPLIIKDHFIGIFGAINSKKGKFFRYDRELLKAIGSQIDTAIFEDRERTVIKNVFKRYVSDKVVEEMLKTPDSKFLIGKRQKLTAVFADIRYFTDLSEEMDAEMLVRTVNEYIEAMSEEIILRDGTIDKIVGDQVMALFGAPMPRSDHATVAIETAIAMQRAMIRLHRWWRRSGRPTPGIGIGVHSGEAIVGNIGCEKISDYTALGVDINIAARLCGKAPAGQILISAATHRAMGKKFRTRNIGQIKVKGIRQPINVYYIIFG